MKLKTTTFKNVEFLSMFNIKHFPIYKSDFSNKIKIVTMYKKQKFYVIRSASTK
jgi:hypothetical protein